jgi:hypothetical protein
MAVTNFVPDLWSAKLLVALRKRLVAGVACVNRDYEGEIKRQGDSVKITSINDVTIGSYTSHSDITVEDIDDATRSLLIDQAKYFAVELDDVEKAQHVKGGGSPLAQAVDNAAYQLASTADAFLLDLINDAAEGTSNDLGTVAIHTTARNLYDSFVDLAVALDVANVPEMGRFAVVSPAVHGRLLKLDEFIAEDSALKTRRKNVTQHHEGIFIRAGGHVIEARIRHRDTHGLGVRSVDGIAENPTARRAVRGHALLTCVTFAASGDARNDDAVAFFEARDCGTNLLDDADAFVTESASFRDGGYVPLHDM